MWLWWCYFHIYDAEVVENAEGLYIVGGYSCSENTWWYLCDNTCWECFSSKCLVPELDMSWAGSSSLLCFVCVIQPVCNSLASVLPVFLVCCSILTDVGKLILWESFFNYLKWLPTILHPSFLLFSVGSFPPCWHYTNAPFITQRKSFSCCHFISISYFVHGEREACFHKLSGWCGRFPSSAAQLAYRQSCAC